LARTKNKLPRTTDELAALVREQEQVARVNISILSGWRKDADITQAQMGHALGLSEDVISNIEALKRPLSMAGSIVWARLAGRTHIEYFEELAFRLRKIYPRKR
jgi:DNA-binding XRE family transcriptional regulator